MDFLSIIDNTIRKLTGNDKPLASPLPKDVISGVKGEMIPMSGNSPYTPPPSPLPKEYADNQFHKIAAPIFQKYDIPLSVGFGQYAAEGRDKGLGASRNNFYNIAAYDGRESGMPGFKTPAEGVEAYAKLLATDPRYKRAYEARKDPAQMVKLIKEAGYATRPDYAEFVMSTPEFKKYMKALSSSN